MKCPACGLFNAEGAVTCDCGFDLTDRELAAKVRGHLARRASLRLLLGVAVTMAGGVGLVTAHRSKHLLWTVGALVLGGFIICWAVADWLRVRER